MAAGLGFKTFTTGEVLTAADTNGYLMQGINVFASSAARAAAITSPQEGQYSYLKDTNALEYYDGAAWVGAPVGDITAVTAGKGLTGGGSSGDVTVSLATTAKGDLVAGSGASTAAVLSVGANNTVLTADSTAATGLKWASASTGFSGALATKSTTQSIAGATFVTLTFDTEANGFDTGTYHDNTTNNSRMTVPTTGYYRITAAVTFDATNNGSYRSVFLNKNGTTIYVSNQGANGIDWTNIPINFVASATASDYFELVVYAPPNPTTVQGNNAYQALTFFSVQYLGA